MKLLDTWVAVNQQWCKDRLRTGWSGLIQGAGSGGHAKPLYPTMQAAADVVAHFYRSSGMPVPTHGSLIIQWGKESPSMMTPPGFNSSPKSRIQTFLTSLRSFGQKIRG